VKTLPINYVVAGRRVLVVGGGRVALRKVRRLVDCGAEVTVVSPIFCQSLARLAGIRRVGRRYRKTDLRGVCLAIVATDSAAVNRRVWEHAEAVGIPVNVVDQPDLCTFTVPAVVVRGDLVLTVSTGGGSPAMSRQVRQELEDAFGPAYGIQLALLRELRGVVQAGKLSAESRQAFFRRLAGPELRLVIESEGKAAARRLLRQWLRQALAAEQPGSGPSAAGDS